MGLVVVVGVEGEVAEDFSGVGVDDVDFEFFDEHGDVGSGIGSADADVVEFAGVAERDGACVSDDVTADPVVVFDR